MIYTDNNIDQTSIIRSFDSDLSQDSLLWHRDEEDRIISPIHETDWMIQFDNQLPIKISGEIHIQKGNWHRLIKGTNNLDLKIVKLSCI